MLHAGAGVNLTLQNTYLVDVLLYPASSARPAWPAAIQSLSGNAASGNASISLTITHSIIRTSCSIWNSYADAALSGALAGAVTQVRPWSTAATMHIVCNGH